MSFLFNVASSRKYHNNTNFFEIFFGSFFGDWLNILKVSNHLDFPFKKSSRGSIPNYNLVYCAKKSKSMQNKRQYLEIHDKLNSVVIFLVLRKIKHSPRNSRWDCTKHRHRRISWIVSKGRAPIFLLWIKAGKSAFSKVLLQFQQESVVRISRNSRFFDFQSRLRETERS